MCVSNMPLESSFWIQNLTRSYMFIVLINISGSLAQLQGQILTSIPQKSLKWYDQVYFSIDHRILEMNPTSL